MFSENEHFSESRHFQLVVILFNEYDFDELTINIGSPKNMFYFELNCNEIVMRSKACTGSSYEASNIKKQLGV